MCINIYTHTHMHICVCICICVYVYLLCPIGEHAINEVALLFVIFYSINLTSHKQTTLTKDCINSHSQHQCIGDAHHCKQWAALSCIIVASLIKIYFIIGLFSIFYFTTIDTEDSCSYFLHIFISSSVSCPFVYNDNFIIRCLF